MCDFNMMCTHARIGHARVCLVVCGCAVEQTCTSPSAVVYNFVTCSCACAYVHLDARALILQKSAHYVILANVQPSGISLVLLQVRMRVFCDACFLSYHNIQVQGQSARPSNCVACFCARACFCHVAYCTRAPKRVFFFWHSMCASAECAFVVGFHSCARAFARVPEVSE